MRNFAFLLVLPYVAVSYGFQVAFQDEFLGSLSRVVSIPALIAWIFTIYYEGKTRRWSNFQYWFLAVIGWQAASMAWSVDPDATWLRLYRLSIFFGVTVLIWDCLRTKRQAYQALQWLVFGGYALGLTIAGKFFLGYGNVEYTGRIYGQGLSPNENSQLLAMAIPIAWYLAIYREDSNKYLRIANYVYPILAIYAMILTASRGGFVSGLPAFLFVILTFKKAPWFYKMGLYVAVAGMLVYVARLDWTRSQLFSKQIERISSVLSSNENDQLTGRTDIWRAGWEEFKKTPYVGVGAGGFAAATSNYATYKGSSGESLAAHNTYLSVATEQGLIGFFLYIFMGLSGIMAMFRMPGPLKWCWISVMGVWVLAFASVTWEWFPHFYIMLAISVAVSSALGQEESEQVPDSSLKGAKRFRPAPNFYQV